MKKIFCLLGVILFMQQASAQNLDNEVTVNTCNCIYNAKSDSIESVVRNCLVSTIAKLTAEGNDSLKLKLNSAGNINQVFQYYNQLIYKKCTAISLLAEEKEAKYYTFSDSEEANKLFKEAVDLSNEGKLDKAAELYSESLKYDSLFVLALDNLGLMLRQLNKPEEAIPYYERSLAIYPEGRFALINLGVAYAYTGDYNYSLEAYKKYTNLFPNDPEGYYGFARTSIIAKEYETALDNLLIAHQLYLEENSPYLADTENGLRILYAEMLNAGMADLFMKKAGAFVPQIYEPEDYEQLLNIKIDNPTMCKAMEPQVLACTDYILSVPADPENKNRSIAIRTVFEWMMTTPDYKFELDENATKVLAGNDVALSVFMSSMAQYVLKNPDKAGDKDSVLLNAWTTTLNYCENKENKVKLNKELKKSIKANKEGKLVY